MEKSEFKNFVFVAVTQLATIGSGILLSAVLTRSFSVEQFGLFQLFFTYVGISTVFSLPGMNTIISKSIYKKGDGIYPTALLHSIVFAFVTLTISALLLLLIGFKLNLPNPHIMFTLLAAFVFLQAVFKYESIFAGKRLFVLSRKLEMVNQTFTLFVVGVVALYTGNFIYAIIAMLFCKCIFSIVSWWIAFKRLDLKFGQPENKSSLIIESYKFTGISGITLVANNIDRILLGWMDPSSLAIYHIGTLFPKKVKDQLKPLLAIPVSKWAECSQKENFDKLWKNKYKFFSGGLMLTVLLGLLSFPLINILYGDHYQEAIFLSIALSLTMPFLIFSIFFNSYDIYQKNGKIWQVNSIIQRGLGITVLLSTIRPLGMWGAVLATLTSELYMGGVTGWFFIRERKRLWKQG